MKLVAAIPPGLRGDMLDYPRLYAYPAKPELPSDNGFVILDSGAFGLSQSGQKIGIGWMQKLAIHYKRYDASADFPVLGVAPDVYLDARTTMDNWQWWMKNINSSIVPVIQFNRSRRIDLYHVLEQARFYDEFKPPVVAISNPGLRAIEADMMAKVCQIVRETTKAKWLHNLGAGWSTLDVKRWFNLGFDSIDSIAYYTDAKDGLRWRVASDEKEQTQCLDWRSLAVKNFQIALSGEEK